MKRVGRGEREGPKRVDCHKRIKRRTNRRGARNYHTHQQPHPPTDLSPAPQAPSPEPVIPLPLSRPSYTAHTRPPREAEPTNNEEKEGAREGETSALPERPRKKKEASMEGRESRDHRIPESLRAFCSIVSFTAANTSLIFDVSVACVRCG